jgi:CheY-like chemotaxis protein
MNRARNLTQQLLTFAKGGAPLRRTAHLNALIRETAQFALSGSNVSCAFDIAEDLRPCDFDMNQIGQVLDNIVINAVQAMPLGGVIHIRAVNSEIEETDHSTLPRGRYVRISIRDTGVGIPEEIRSRIFDPFFTTKQKGSGLGLATSYSIIHRHGGVIEVDSEAGKGSMFHIVLPASEQPVVHPPPVARPVSLAGYKILLLEDEQVLQKIIGTMLVHEGCSVVCADEGLRAIRAFSDALHAGDPFHAAILDLTIPGGMGGKEALAELRKLDPEIRVFVSSGYADSPVMSNPQEHGFTDSISKPFTRAELLDLLARNLKGRKPEAGPR